MKYVVFRDRYGRDFELHDLESSPLDLHFLQWLEYDAVHILTGTVRDGHTTFLHDCSHLIFRDNGQTATRDPAWVLEALNLYVLVGRFSLYQMLPKLGMSRSADIASLESVSESVEFQRKDISTLELVPEKEQPVALQSRGKKGYWGNNKVDEEMPDETDKKLCPRANFKSESTETASEKVRDFLGKYVRVNETDPVKRKGYWDEDLGRLAAAVFCVTTRAPQPLKKERFCGGTLIKKRVIQLALGGLFTRLKAILAYLPLYPRTPAVHIW
jgi:hypothetical protein